MKSTKTGRHFRMSHRIAFAILTVVATACTKTDDYLRAQVTKHGELTDPASAMFRNVTYSELSIWGKWCGEINAKNRFGGYVGWTPFSVTAYKNGKVNVLVLQLSDPSLEGNTRKRNALAELNQGLAQVHAMGCQGAQPAPTWIPFWES